MGRNSNGIRSGREGRGDSTYSGRIGSPESLKNIQDRQLYRATMSAISRYHAVLGVRQKQVQLATLSGALGVHVTENGQSAGVYLNKKLYKTGTTATVASVKKQAYESGFSTRTNKPVAHTITHELAHATWNSNLTSRNALRASREINTLYNRFMRERPAGYGRYARTNVNEFFAEVATRAVHGTSDTYTDAIKRIVKRHNL